MGAAFMHGLRPVLPEGLGALTCCLLESSAGQPGFRSPLRQAVVARRERWWSSETPHSVRALEFEAVLVRKSVAGGSPEGAGRQQPAPSVARAAGVQWGTDDEDRLPLLRVEVNGQDRHGQDRHSQHCSSELMCYNRAQCAPIPLSAGTKSRRTPHTWLAR